MTYPETVHEFLNQTEYWVNKDGWVPVDDMEALYRRRCAQFLLRRGRHLGTADLDDSGPSNDSDWVKEFIGRLGAPGYYIRETPLYKRLIQDGADPDEWINDERE